MTCVAMIMVMKTNCLVVIITIVRFNSECITVIGQLLVLVLILILILDLLLDNILYHDRRVTASPMRVSLVLII